MPFKTVYIDVAGYCNAKCRWCVTYNDRHIPAQRDFLSPDNFSRILHRLIAIGAVDATTVFSLHNWGEPTLNKDFPDIIDILSKNNFHWGFSTNASIFPNIKNNDLSLLDNLLISMPGFSQSSYDKIHGFSFNCILNNIDKYVKLLSNNLKCLSIYYHVYQFNIEEIQNAYEYASKLKIGFLPIYAYFNNMDLGISYLNKELSANDIYDASTHLVLFYVNDLISNIPQKYLCPQFSYLSLDEFGNVLQCCCINRTQKYYSIGSIFDLTNNEIIERRKKSPACVRCLDSRFAYWAHNPYYYKTFSPNSADYQKKSKLKACLQFFFKTHSSEMGM